MEPFSIVVTAKVVIITIGTVVLVVVVAQFISQLNTPLGYEWFQELPLEMQMQVLQAVGHTRKGKALQSSLIAATSKSKVDVATVTGLMQSLQKFAASM